MGSFLKPIYYSWIRRCSEKIQTSNETVDTLDLTVCTIFSKKKKKKKKDY